MAANSTILCIHRDPEQLRSLQENGYELLTATNGHEGLRLFASRPVDAIVLEYYLGLLDGSVIAAEIKKLRPELPIVMLADDLDLPDGALKSVDALVTKSDGAHFLWATVHFVLNVQPAQRLEEKLKPQIPVHPHRRGRSSGQAHDSQNRRVRLKGRAFFR
ncbi:MAG: response regulator [Candidatus Sulfotelmatobacter sp.]|jgi:DNA-binding response OmpR family regulator